MSQVRIKIQSAIPSIALHGNLYAREKIVPSPGEGKPQSRFVLILPDLVVNAALWPTILLERNRYVYVFDILAGLSAFSLIVEVDGVEVAKEDLDPATLPSASHLSIFFHV